jgi:hypothetical protein
MEQNRIPRAFNSGRQSSKSGAGKLHFHVSEVGLLPYTIYTKITQRTSKT